MSACFHIPAYFRSAKAPVETDELPIPARARARAFTSTPILAANQASRSGRLARPNYRRSGKRCFCRNYVNRDTAEVVPSILNFRSYPNVPMSLLGFDFRTSTNVAREDQMDGIFVANNVSILDNEQ